jgi:pimeloyl-ACP methyl ester carboxylesterase
VPQAVNDRQWKVMQAYYRDQPSLPGYLYLALRAPNDTWNGFYDEYVPPLLVRLIRQFLLLGDVDPSRVYLLGYSHGGYGAFYLGPKIPDRFAAVHSSAAAPTDGAISPRNLRNTRFTFMVGEQDNAYGRRERCERFDAAVRKLRAQDATGYPVVMELKKGFGHGGLPDRDWIKEMYPFTRDPAPHRLAWDLTDSVVREFFWLSVAAPARGQALDATVEDQAVVVATKQVGAFDLYLDSRLVSLEQPVQLTVDGKQQTIQPRPRLQTLCETLLERGDPELAWTCRVRLLNHRDTETQREHKE